MKLNVAHVLCLILSGICIGFEVMSSHESPNVPFTLFKTRFSKGGHNMTFVIMYGS